MFGVFPAAIEPPTAKVMESLAMEATITLDESHFCLLVDKARSHGTTPDRYLASLIDADKRTFDEILDPVRKGFESMCDDELEGLTGRAMFAARSNSDEGK